MIYNKYFILILSLSILYSAIFEHKDDRLMRVLGIIIGAGGTLISVGAILTGIFPNHKETIKRIMELPTWLLGIPMLILITAYAWRMRKDPEKKAAAYGWLVVMVLSVIGMIVVIFFM